MKKIIFILVLLLCGFALPGNDYKEDAPDIERELRDLEKDKQDKARLIFTAAPDTDDGVVGEIRLVNLGSGTSYYSYYKFAETTWVKTGASVTEPTVVVADEDGNRWKIVVSTNGVLSTVKF